MGSALAPVRLILENPWILLQQIADREKKRAREIKTWAPLPTGTFVWLAHTGLTTFVRGPYIEGNVMQTGGFKYIIRVRPESDVTHQDSGFLPQLSAGAVFDAFPKLKLTPWKLPSPCPMTAGPQA